MRSLLAAFLTGAGVTFVVLLAAYPIVAIVSDATGAGSFNAAVGGAVLYRFIRSGRSLLAAFLTGAGVTFVVLLAAYPIVAIVSDATGAGSFNAAVGGAVLYRFIRSGDSATTLLVPVGLLVFSLVGGVVNMALRLAKSWLSSVSWR